MKILFLHGWNSIPGGVKPTFLAEAGHEVINPKLPDDDFDAALAIAQTKYDVHQPDVIVGSSRGGAIAMNVDCGDTPLVLLCPARKKYGWTKRVKPGTVILHSRADEVIPFADSEELVENSGATLIETGIDHRLADPESLEVLLGLCLISQDEPTEDEQDILEKDWTGLCYTAVLHWVSDAEEDDWLVVHGTVLSDKVGKRIEHAWCERGDFVVDLAMPVGSRIIVRERYYRVVQPEISRSYSADQAMLLSVRNKHHGPWGEGEQLEE